MPSKGVPFPIDDWPSVVIRGLEVLNENNWFPAMTLIIGNPGETDDDVEGDARLDLRSRAARAVRVLHPVDLHAAARHADGEEGGRDRNRPAHAAAVAVDDEVLEDEPAAGSDELVGTDGVAARRARHVGVQAAQAQRPGLHLADDHVRQRAARSADGPDGQDSRRAADPRQDAQGAARRRSSRTSGSTCARTTATFPEGGPAPNPQRVLKLAQAV